MSFFNTFLDRFKKPQTPETPPVIFPNPDEDGAHYVPYGVAESRLGHLLAYRTKYFPHMLVEVLARAGQRYSYRGTERPAQTVDRGMVLVKIAAPNGSASSEWMSLVHYAGHNTIDEPPVAGDFI